MSNDIDARASRYREELAQGDREDCAAANAEMSAPALILVSAAVGVASWVAHETIGLTLNIIGLIAGFVWRSDLKAKSAARSARRSDMRKAMDSLMIGMPKMDGIDGMDRRQRRP